MRNRLRIAILPQEAHKYFENIFFNQKAAMKNYVTIAGVIGIILVNFSVIAMDKAEQKKAYILYAQLSPLASFPAQSFQLSQKTKADKESAELQKKFLVSFKAQVDKDIWSKRKEYEGFFERQFKESRDYRPEGLIGHVRACMIKKIQSIYEKQYHAVFPERTLSKEQAKQEAENYYEDKQSCCSCFGT